MSLKEKFVSAKNNIVADLKQNSKKYLVAAGLGLGIGTLYVLKGLARSQNELLKSHRGLIDTVNHNAEVTQWHRSHPLYIQRIDDDKFEAIQTHFPEYDLNPTKKSI